MKKLNDNMAITIYIPLCVGGSKANAGQYFLYFPATRATYILLRKEPGQYIYIAREGGSFNPQFNL